LGLKYQKLSEFWEFFILDILIKIIII
jgi:hypothetical protein